VASWKYILGRGVTQCNVDELPAECQAGGKNGRDGIEREGRPTPATPNLHVCDDGVVFEQDSD